MFSDLPLGWKLFTLAMFLWIMGGVTWFAKKLAYEWIPVALVGYVAVAMVAFGLGYLLRERILFREIEKRRNGRAPADWRE